MSLILLRDTPVTRQDAIVRHPGTQKPTGTTHRWVQSYMQIGTPHRPHTGIYAGLHTDTQRLSGKCES